MSTETLAGIGLALAALAIIAVIGIGPFAMWLLLAAVAAPIIGRAIRSDEAFDICVEDDEE